MFLITLTITLILATTSCWNSKELNEISIVTGVGIDPSDKEGEYSYIYQIVNPSAYGGNGVGNSMTPSLIIKSKAKTMFDSVRKASTVTTRRLYFGHIQVLLINSDIAEDKGIKDLLEFFYRDHEIRENIEVLITKDVRTEDILSSQSALEKMLVFLSKKIKNTYKSSSFSFPTELRKIVSTLMNPTSSAIVSTITLSPPINKEKLDSTQATLPPSVIESIGLAIFNNDKLVGYLNNHETRALNWITDNVKKE